MIGSAPPATRRTAHRAPLQPGHRPHQRADHRTVRRLVLAGLVAGAVVQLVLLSRAVAPWVQEVSLLRTGEAAVQRRVNGPLVPLAQRLQRELPERSCLQFLHPDLTVARQTRRFYTFFNIYVLGNHLYPRGVRLAADAEEALSAPQCGSQPPFALVWLEYENRGSAGFDRVNGLLEHELRRLQAADRAEQRVRYEDAQGNAGYVFEIWTEYGTASPSSRR